MLLIKKPKKGWILTILINKHSMSINLDSIKVAPEEASTAHPETDHSLASCRNKRQHTPVSRAWQFKTSKTRVLQAVLAHLLVKLANMVDKGLPRRVVWNTVLDNTVCPVSALSMSLKSQCLMLRGLPRNCCRFSQRSRKGWFLTRRPKRRKIQEIDQLKIKVRMTMNWSLICPKKLKEWKVRAQTLIWRIFWDILIKERIFKLYRSVTSCNYRHSNSKTLSRRAKTNWSWPEKASF